MNEKFKGAVGSNPMEFFNKIEMGKEQQDSKEFNNKKNNGNRLKRIENMLKNSNGEFFLEEKDRFFIDENTRNGNHARSKKGRRTR